jgi:hypothetical protein
MHKGHDILQLITESVRTAGLIKSRTAPESTAQSLIKQPAIEQKVRGKFRRLHFDRAQESVPPLAGFFECGFDVGGIAKMHNESTRFFFVVCLPDEKSHFCGVPGFNLNCHLHSGTRVKAGTHVTSQSFVLDRCGITQRAITPDEHRAIGRKRSRRWS